MCRSTGAQGNPNRAIDPTTGSTSQSDVQKAASPDGDGTFVTLIHDSLPQGERDIHEAGWSLYLGRLVTVAEGGDPGPDPSLQGVG
jgi:hypothetical protein